MDLIAPNPAIMRTGFIQLGIILVMFVVAQLKMSTVLGGPRFIDKLRFWAKMNAPLVAVILCEAWAIASYLLFRPAPNIDEYFVAGVWMAGGSSIVSALMKDARDGSMKATDELDVREMRRDNPKRGGIGS